ncbi:hypothetical protein NMY22_g744 [Coprinellus aureogranulatus]|nr:hypothetical protein NMY22_g744 [Coprinellus aureogranulatus]
MSSSYFANSHNVVYDNTFITATNYIHDAGSSDRALDYLNDHVAVDALHNSDERCDAPKCHPDTRVAVQAEILSWITDGDQDDEPKKILWLTGPAGTGKTAIAGSIAETCEERGFLAGSFFFSSYGGSDSRRSKKGLMAALAYGLLQCDSLRPVHGQILSAVVRDRHIFRKRLKDQCQALLLAPFRNFIGEWDVSSLPKVIVVDAIDEIEAVDAQTGDKHEKREACERDQIEVLTALLQVAKDAHFPFRIIIVSRPERAIQHFFSSDAKSVSRKLFLDDQYHPSADVALYLKANIAEIARRYHLSSSWVTEGDLGRLVKNASGQFIYAATVVRFLRHGSIPLPKRIDHILSLPTADQGHWSSFTSLDALYTGILMASPDPAKAVCWIAMISRSASLGRPTPALFVRQFLQEYQGEANYLLENLASLISIPHPGDRATPYRLYHQSLIDFLSKRQRCGEILHEAYIDSYAYEERCCQRIIRARSPAVPLADGESTMFIRRFMTSLFGQFLNRTTRDRRTSDEDWSPRRGISYRFPACNSTWWMDNILDAFSYDDEAVAHLGSFLYDNIHSNYCPTNGTCDPACKHWRSGIVQSFKGHGWGVPGPSALLREILFSRWRSQTSTSLCITLGESASNQWVTKLISHQRYFQAPRKPLRSKIPSHSTSLYKDAEIYCHLMLGRLQDNWMVLYGEEIEGGMSTPYDALSACISELERDCGIEELNLAYGTPSSLALSIQERYGINATSVTLPLKPITKRPYIPCKGGMPPHPLAITMSYYYDPYDFSDTSTSEDDDQSYMQQDGPSGEQRMADFEGDSDIDMASVSGRSGAPSQSSSAAYTKASLSSFGKDAKATSSITSYEREGSSRSASPDSVVSMTDSLRTRMYREEFGRGLNNYSEIYRLPADEEEWSRLEKQHIMHIEMIGAKYPPPMGPVMQSTIPGDKKVLDLGCGSGAWIRDVARDFPLCEVVGVDLVPIRDASSLPPNARNEVDDINFGLQHFYGQYDVVHCRLISSGIKDYELLIDRIARVLKPGGLIELTEWDFHTYDKHEKRVPVSTADARLGPPWWARYLAHMRDAAQASGGHTDAATYIRDWVTNCGAFENVYYHDFWSPVIPGDDNRYPESVYAKMLDIIPAFLASGRPLLLGNGVTEAEFEILEQNTLRELHHSDVPQFTRMHPYTDGHGASARKNSSDSIAEGSIPSDARIGEEGERESTVGVRSIQGSEGNVEVGGNGDSLQVYASWPAERAVTPASVTTTHEARDVGANVATIPTPFTPSTSCPLSPRNARPKGTDTTVAIGTMAAALAQTPQRGPRALGVQQVYTEVRVGLPSLPRRSPIDTYRWCAAMLRFRFPPP